MFVFDYEMNLYIMKELKTQPKTEFVYNYSANCKGHFFRIPPKCPVKNSPLPATWSKKIFRQTL